MLSDILSFVLGRGVQHYAKESRSTVITQCLVNEQAMMQDVFRNSLKLLHALAYKNEIVRIVSEHTK